MIRIKNKGPCTLTGVTILRPFFTPHQFKKYETKQVKQHK